MPDSLIWIRKKIVARQMDKYFTLGKQPAYFSYLHTADKKYIFTGSLPISEAVSHPVVLMQSCWGAADPCAPQG